MELISGTIDFKIEQPTAVMLGKFDGVHHGHLFLIDKLLAQKEKGYQTVVFTFDKSPASLFIQDGSAYRELCSIEEKRDIFQKMGVDFLVEFPMNMDTAAIPAEEFITEILQKQLNCKVIIAGEDISFGHRGIGDKDMLLENSTVCGYEVEIYRKLMTDALFLGEEQDEEISSTNIRKAILIGNIERANVLMNRPFVMTGNVVYGNQLGSTIFKMPTANVKWPDNKVIPAFGVYYTKIIVDGICYNAITNVGSKPTIAGSESKEILAESYLYDFEGNLYGKDITIQFYHFKREEVTFESMPALKKQLEEDMQAGQKYWNE